MCQLCSDTFITLILGVIDLDPLNLNFKIDIIAHKYCVIEHSFVFHCYKNITFRIIIVL